MKWLVATLIGLLLMLQYQLWIGSGSYFYTWRIKHELAEQKQKTSELQDRNKILEAEVEDLKQGHQALEELARNHLGMVKKGETFYQVIGPTNKHEQHDTQP